ncbi:hypothetical protein [Robbsia sp. KACC 23696]|uniref:phage tail fiber protein n=1 Tax=Robbsia sp. KACC 23696 TaxID=3149231 RepID=UPI00325B8AD1
MADKTLTSANSVLLIGVTGLYTVPQQLQGFSEDDMYSMEAVDTAELKMGADGVLSAGWIPQIKTMGVTLQADSDSNTFFEAWYAAQEAAQEILYGFGSVTQTSVGKSYPLLRGVLSSYTPFAEAKKTLQPRKFQIKWQTALGVPI